MTSPSAPTSRVVRVFISSTFRDFGEERDLLMKRVFPELRRRARDRFVEVIGVDLRWGITEEESQQGETLPICLREIERSRPYFIGLLGERYGWTPEAGQYPENLLAQQPWLAEHAGGKSVTELEILHGVLNAPEMAGRAYFYFRDAAWSEGRGADYRSEGVDERAKLGRLKERIRSSEFPSVEFSTPEALADRITDDLWKLIDAEYPEDEVPDELERERRSHEAYAHERKRLYVGQDETVAALLARIEGASDEKGEEGSRSRTTLVTGESGTGKSALIANVLASYRESHPTHVVIEHYIGSTSDASDPMKLMRRVAGEIKKMTESSREIEDDPEKLAEQFAEWLAEASWWARGNERIVVLALDALDKLSHEARLRWLPKITAPHLRIVMSSLAGESRAVLEERGVESVEAKPFTHEVARNYIVETLARRGRKLPEREVDRIVAHPRATLPIYLKTLVEELSVFGSHEGLPQRITECLAAQEPDDLFEVILARLEEDLGRDAVKRPLEAIWASSEGMSEDELIGFTGVSPLELARLRLSLDDALYESGGLLRLAHAYASKGVEDRYAPTDEAKQALHLALGLWWEKQEPSTRMAYQLNSQLYAAQAWDKLRFCLCRPKTGPLLVVKVDLQELYRSWSAIASYSGQVSVGEVLSEYLEPLFELWLIVPRQASEVCATLTSLLSLLRLAGSRRFACRAAELLLQTAEAELSRAPSREARYWVAVGGQWLGLAYEAADEMEPSERAFVAALIAAREMITAIDSPAVERGSPQALACGIIGHLARVSLRLGNVESAQRLAREGMAIARQQLSASPSVDNQMLLGMQLLGLSRALEVGREYVHAKPYAQECVALARKVFGDSGSRLALTWLGDALDDLGRLEEHCFALGSPEAILQPETSPHRRLGRTREAARKCYEESLDIAERLWRELAAHEQLRGIAVTLGNLGRTYEMDGDLKTAGSFYEQAIARFRSLVADVNSVLYVHDLSTALDKLAMLRCRERHIEEAFTLYDESLGLLRYCANADRSSWQEAYHWGLEHRLEIAAENGQWVRGRGYASERLGCCRNEVADARTARTAENTLCHVLPLMGCDLELKLLDEAAELACVVDSLVWGLVAAFDDEKVDRAEQQLDSTTLFRCASGIELVARLRDLEGNHEAQAAAAEFASELRASAEQLKAKEDAATDEESSQ